MRERLQSASVRCRQEHATLLCVCVLSAVLECYCILCVPVRRSDPFLPAGPLVFGPWLAAAGPSPR